MSTQQTTETAAFGYQTPGEVSASVATSEYGGDNPRIDWMGLIGGVANIAESENKRLAKDDLLTETAEKALMKARYNKMKMTNEFVTANSDGKLQYTADFLQNESSTYPDGTPMGAYAINLVSGDFKKHKEGVVDATNREVYSSASNLMDTWLSTNKGGTPEQFVDFTKKMYPTVEKTKLKDALMVGLFTELEEGLNSIDSLQELKDYDDTIKEKKRPYMTSKFLDSKAKEYQKYVKELETQYETKKATKIKELKGDARVPLIEVAQALGGDEYLAISPSMNKIVHEKAAIAYYDDPAGLAKWEGDYAEDN